jgi:hypothetical protein
LQHDNIHTIRDALSLLATPQPISIASATAPTIEATQQVLIETLPQVLVVHLVFV